jgi:hypothetical protein
MKMINDIFSRAKLTKNGAKYFKNMLPSVIDEGILMVIRFPQTRGHWLWSLSWATFRCRSL